MKFPFKMDLAMRTARALMAPTPQVDSTPAATSLPDPQQLAEQVRASIAQAITTCRDREREAGQKLEAALKQREVVATARAAEVIAAIPEKVRAETEGWNACRRRPKYQTMIMIIDNLESEPRASDVRCCHSSEHGRMSCPEHELTMPTLLWAARIVFDFCQQAFLAPSVVFHEADASTGREAYYAIHIEWTMPKYD